MDDEDLREAVDCQVLLDVRFSFAAATFESCPNHSLRLYELLHALAELNAAKVADCLARNLHAQVHKVIKGAILEPTAQALSPIDELPLKEVGHDRVVSGFIITVPLLTLLIDWHVCKVQLAVCRLRSDAVQLVMHAVDQEAHELLRVLLPVT